MGRLPEISEDLIKNYEAYGYSRELIIAASQICQNLNNPNSMIDAIEKVQKENEILLNSTKKVILRK